MSDSSISIVRLDALSDKQINHVAAAVTARLLDLQVISLNTRFNELWRPSPWQAGSTFTDVVAEVPWADTIHDTANSGVDITAARAVFHPVENDEEPRCATCGSLAPTDYTETYEDWLVLWLDEATEPSFTCTCGWSAPVGDWTGECSVAVGAPAITFHNWPDLTEPFIADLRHLLGGRTAVVRTHL